MSCPDGFLSLINTSGLVRGSGGSALRGYIPACTEADTPPPPPVDRQTPVKILLWPNFVAAGKNSLSFDVKPT